MKKKLLKAFAITLWLFFTTPGIITTAKAPSVWPLILWVIIMLIIGVVIIEAWDAPTIEDDNMEM